MNALGKKIIADTAIGTSGATRSRVPAQFYPVELCTDISIGSPKLWEAYAQGLIFPTIKVYLFRDGVTSSGNYYTVEYSNCQLLLVNDRLEYTGSGQYSHKQIIRFNYESVEWTYEGGVTQASWNLESGEQ